MNEISNLLHILLHGPKTTAELQYADGIPDALEIAKNNPKIFMIHRTSFSTPIISSRSMSMNMNKNLQQIQNGKGSRPRPVKGDVFRERFEQIFGKKEKPTKKEKSEKTKCPHCSTMNLVQETHWMARCLKCGWTR